MEKNKHLSETPENRPMAGSTRIRKNMASILNGTGKIMETTGVLAGAVAGGSIRIVTQTTLSFFRHLLGR